MDVFLMVQRKNCTVFTDAKESTCVHELKKILNGITNISPENQKLFKDDVEMLDDKCLGDYGINSGTASAQAPATLALAYRTDNGDFEVVEVNPLSIPPELPEVMKNKD